MEKWSLPKLLGNIHNDIERRLATVRESFCHPGAKGDGSETVWLDLLNTYLPKRYQCANAFVVDSLGNFSDQLDVVIFDRQYSPFVFYCENQTIIPAESVYAVFEVKQALNASVIAYAQNKIKSVRCLQRTSLPIPHAGGTYKAKPLTPIWAGVLALESDWSPALGAPLLQLLKNSTQENELLHLGCVASHGYFYFDDKKQAFVCESGQKSTTAWLFKLIERLQSSGTVPMIDIQAYAKWI